MYVLHSGIAKENRALLQSVVSRFENASLTFIDTGDFLLREWQKGNFDGHQRRTQFPLEVIIRCFAAKFFPQYDKIIYSDVDVVFKDDISELYDIDLTGKYLAAVRDPFLKFSKTELAHLPLKERDRLDSEYFAGGILVFNLAQIRKDNLEDEMLKVINDDTVVKKFPDQDVMNIACKGKVAYLPLNYIAFPYLLDYLQKPDFVSHYSRDELFDSIINPKILHFAAFKPWKAEGPRWEEWWSIYRYLNLPKTKLIAVDYTRYKNRVRKLRRVIRILSGAAAVALVWAASATCLYFFK